MEKIYNEIARLGKKIRRIRNSQISVPASRFRLKQFTELFFTPKTSRV